VNDYRDGRALDRFIESKIGQPWDKVYSQLCSLADRRSKVGQDLRQRIKWSIETDGIQMIEGKPISLKYNRYASYTPIHGLYVHPETGLICNSPKPQYKSKKLKETEVDLIFLVPDAYYEKINGCWFHLWIEDKETTLPATLIEDKFGNLGYRTVTVPLIRHITHKKQLNKKEIFEYVIPVLYKGTSKKFMANRYNIPAEYKRWKTYFSSDK
jgi:hypothetical protein